MRRKILSVIFSLITAIFCLFIAAKAALANSCYIKYASCATALNEDYEDKELFVEGNMNVGPISWPHHTLLVLPYKYEESIDDDDYAAVEYKIYKTCSEVPYDDKVDYGCFEMDGIAYPYLLNSHIQDLLNNSLCEVDNGSGVEIQFDTDASIIVTEPIIYNSTKKIKFNWCDEEDDNCSTKDVSFRLSWMFEEELDSNDCTINVGSNVKIADIHLASSIGIPVCINGSNNEIKDSEIVNEDRGVRINGDDNILSNMSFRAGVEIKSGTTGNIVTNIDGFHSITSNYKAISIDDGANDYDGSDSKSPELKLKIIKELECTASSDTEECYSLKATLNTGEEVTFAQNNDTNCEAPLFVSREEIENCNSTPDNPKCYLLEMKAPAGKEVTEIELYEITKYDSETGQPKESSNLIGCTKYDSGVQRAFAVIPYEYNENKDNALAIIATGSNGTSEFSSAVPVDVDADGDGIPDENDCLGDGEDLNGNFICDPWDNDGTLVTADEFPVVSIMTAPIALGINANIPETVTEAMQEEIVIDDDYISDTIVNTTGDNETGDDTEEIECGEGLVLNAYGACVSAKGTSEENSEESSDGGGCSLKKKDDGTYGCSLTKGATGGSMISYLIFFLLLVLFQRFRVGRKATE